jgi:hypothetical protein
MIKIKAICNWASSEDITRRLIEQFKTSENDLNGVEFVYDDTYDVCVVFGYVSEEIKDNTKIILFPQEPTWTGGHQKNFDRFIKVFGYDKSKYYQSEMIIETIAHMFYGSTGPWQEGWDFWNYNNIINSNFEKTKGICSFISNRGINDESHPDGCLYGDRLSLVNSIHNKVPFVDFYGWGDGNGSNLKPFTLRKGDTIKDYKFCLTVENSSEKYYISEKFYDCILTNTIPIYFGCSNIKDYWPENNFILLDNITDHQYVTDKLQWINENCDELYDKMLPNILKMKDRYFEEFNLLKKIKKEIYEF